MKAATSDSERKQLLSGNTANPFYQVSEAVLRRGESVGEAEETMVQEEDRSSCGHSIAKIIALFLLINLVWLASTGFVVVPPGELAVIVTLVR